MAESISRSPHRLRNALITGVLIAATLASGFALWRYKTTETTQATQTARSLVPVTVATVQSQDVPLYLSGLGVVQASNTTAIHSQVDGKLQSVNFSEGQMVHRGDILVQIDPRLYQAALDQAKAKKAQDEAQLVSAQKDLERYQTLVAKAAETQQNLDRQRAVVDGVKAAIEADQAAIESAQTQLDYTTIRAPTDGRMGIRQIDPGNIVHAADTTPIVVLTQTRPISVIFTLPEKNLADVREAMARGPVPVVAFDQDDSKALATGTLMLIDNEIDQTTGTIKLKASFPNDDERLWSGAFVHAHLLNDTRKNALTVPSAAIQRGPQGLFVWRIQPDETAQVVPVEATLTPGDSAIVGKGVAAGDHVVVNGQYRLQAGTKVDVKPLAAAGGDAS